MFFFPLEAVVIALLGLALACAAAKYGVFQMAAFFLLALALSRVRLPLPRADVENTDFYLKKEDFPLLYEIAERAKTERNVEREIRICLLPDNNAGVSVYRDGVLLHIGAPLLIDDDENELYAMLLHEFSHVAAGKKEKDKRYQLWLSEGKTRSFFVPAPDFLFFSCPDSLYSFYFSLYELSVTTRREAEADRAMAAPEYRDAAGSMLIKIFFRSCDEYEQGTYDFESPFRGEEPIPDLFSLTCRQYEARRRERERFWLSLIPKEILSRSASHPTLKMRLDALGVTEYRALSGTASASYEAEREKIREQADRLLLAVESEDYEAKRRERYLEPMARIAAWEEAGRPVEPEGYADVVDALRTVGRNTEALALCRRATEELPDAAALFGYFMVGCHLLHCYDATGIDLVYHAIENNSNFVEEGLDQIGRFCVLTGNQEELARYREKSVLYAQKDKDVYCEYGVLRKSDDLSAERLPDGMLDEILSYIRSVDEGKLEKIYLVHKTITEGEAVSVFVICFEEGCDPEAEERIYHKIFRYLDTAYEWQFSLLSDVGPDVITRIGDCLVFEKEKKETSHA